MARLAHVVVLDLPHHGTNRGNRRGDIFLRDADRTVYLTRLHQASTRAQAGLAATMPSCNRTVSCAGATSNRNRPAESQPPGHTCPAKAICSTSNAK